MTKIVSPAAAQTLAIRRLPHGKTLPLPAYATPGSSGMDLAAATEEADEIVIPAGGQDIVPTGLALALPQGMEAQIRPRSGLAAKHGVTVLNSPGTIDADYRGEIKVILINHGKADFVIKRGDRIAQMVIQPVTQVELTEVESLDETSRGQGGFGSTGTGTGTGTGKT